MTAMKKIFYIFSIVVLGSLVAGCNLNSMPIFDDEDAFAAFPNNAMKVAENAGTLNIPVHVASFSGVNTTVTYEFVNGSAKQGVDFEDASGTGSISFSGSESTKNITVKIIEHPGVFTGDLNFSVKFKSAGDTKIGASNTCTVTIIRGKIDTLEGLKENVICGHLIPAGTGQREFDNLIVASMDDYQKLAASRKKQ